jgi:hypothetical protein
VDVIANGVKQSIPLRHAELVSASPHCIQEIADQVRNDGSRFPDFHRHFRLFDVYYKTLSMTCFVTR